jgi:hypothetical protein
MCRLLLVADGVASAARARGGASRSGIPGARAIIDVMGVITAAGAFFLVRWRHHAGLGGTMVASASTIATVIGAGTIVTITVTIGAIIATIISITIMTVALTASAGGILVRVTSLLARTIVGSFSRMLAARLVLLLLELGEG